MKEEANMQASRDNLILKISVALGIYYMAVIAYSIYAQMYYFGDTSNKTECNIIRQR
jgi:hypothetical protein